MSGFKNHFSDASGDYAAFRPSYPDALFAWLAAAAPACDTAWDCATGSGQAALGLATRFSHVLASDASAAQIAHASPHPRVVYRAAPAEASGLADASVDLVTVAQAAHWFDLPRFYAEARRVLKPGGVLALWGYGHLELPGDLAAPYQRFHTETVGPWWPPERALVENRYRDLDFPFEEIAAPAFAIEAEWTLPRLLAYLATWSAVKRCRAATGGDPLPALAKELARQWREPDTAKPLVWPLFMRVARMPA